MADRRTYVKHDVHPVLGQRVRLDHPHLEDGGFAGIGSRHIAGAVITEDEARALGYEEREPDPPEERNFPGEPGREIEEPGTGPARTAKRPGPRGE